MSIVSQPNFGLAAARNSGVRKASGEYCAFVDSDDYIHHEMLQVMLAAALDQKSDIVICSFQEVSEEGEVRAVHEPDQYDSVHEYYCSILASKSSSMICNKLVKRTVFVDNAIEFSVGLYHEDVPTVFKLFEHVDAVATVNRPFYNWVRRAGSISKSVSEKHVVDLFSGFIQTRDHLRCAGTYLDYRVHFNRRVLHFATGLVQRMKYYEQEDQEKWTELIYDFMQILDTLSQQNLAELAEFDSELHDRTQRLFGRRINARVPSDEMAVELRRLNECVAKLKPIAEQENSAGKEIFNKFSVIFETIFPPKTIRRRFARKVGSLLR